MAAPIKKVKNGNVSGSLWVNEFDGKKIYNWSFEKSYKKKDETWHNVNSYGENELYKLHALIGHIINGSITKKNADNGEKNAEYRPPAQEQPPTMEEAQASHIPF